MTTAATHDDDCPFLCGDDCFIATAAFGSRLDPHVGALRAFRDQGLMRILPGRLFVATYNTLSPPLARFIASGTDCGPWYEPCCGRW